MHEIDFDTWVINISKNKIRRDFISNQLDLIGIDYNIFNAITPSSKTDIKHNYNERRTEIHYGRPLMKTELACALSHISLWIKLLNQNQHSHYLILEDDVVIDKKLKKLLKSYDFRQFDASAYLISKKAVLKILPYALELNFAIDVIMDRSFEHKIPIYAVKPYPIESKWHNDPKDPLFTDIGLRTYKYSKNRKFLDRFRTRLVRIKTSYHRRIARLKLFFDC